MSGRAAALYTWLAARPLTGRGMWLNLGYWREATEIEAASEALAMRVAEAGRMGPADEVVDVGFGFADQDMLWAERIGPRRITGLNVTPLQVRIGRARVARRGLSDVIDLRAGSATAMPLPAASADLVIALECAFHFDTRVEFFAEAHRVLRPGGRLVTADIIRGAPARNLLEDLLWAAFRRAVAMPAANGVRRTEYAAQLKAAGFATATVEDISAEIFPGWHRALRGDAALRARLPLAARAVAEAIRPVAAERLYRPLDYVLAVAVKG